MWIREKQKNISVLEQLDSLISELSSLYCSCKVGVACLWAWLNERIDGRGPSELMATLDRPATAKAVSNASLLYIHAER